MAVLPEISVTTAERIARELYGVECAAEALVSYRDRNFRLETPEGERFVLKVTHPDELREEIEAQHEAMRLASLAGLAVPRVLPSVSGRSIEPLEEVLDGAGLIRLLSWLPGKFLVEVSPHPTAVLCDLGEFLGRLDLALAELDHPGTRRTMDWDLARAAGVRRDLDALEAGWKRERARGIFDRFEEGVEPVLPGLPRGVIHNDANEHNVLVETDEDGGGRVSGLIDFGDLVETVLVAELGVACAYAMLDEPDPLASALEIVRGYHAVLPLTEVEARLLPALIEARLAVSVTKGAAGLRRNPENVYLVISSKPAWRLLERLEELDPAQVERAFVGVLEEGG